MRRKPEVLIYNPIIYKMNGFFDVLKDCDVMHGFVKRHYRPELCGVTIRTSAIVKKDMKKRIVWTMNTKYHLRGRVLDKTK